MGSQKLKVTVRGRVSAPASRRGRAVRPKPARKPAKVVRFDVVPAPAGQSRMDAAAADLASLRAVVDQQAVDLNRFREALRLQLESLDAIALSAPAAAGGHDVLDATLQHAHATLIDGIESVRRVLGVAGPARPASPRRQPAIEPFVRAKARRTGYDHMRRDVAEAVRSVGLNDAITLVVSRGDQGLIEAAGRQAWHFPQNDDGVYAGYHPAGSGQAIRHLEALRAKGAAFLVIPATAAWWLDYYGEFRRHLDARYRLLFAEPDQCAIYDLRADGTSKGHGDDQPN